MRLVSWNVNGIRSVIGKGFHDWLEEASPDVLCLQETRIQADQLAQHLLEPAGYHATWCHAERKGYSGVTTWCKVPPLHTQCGFGADEFDVEGRVLVTQHPGFVLLNVYFPNGGRGLERLDYKLRFYEALLAYCDERHARGERLVVCGDYNTAHHPIDLARPKENAKTSGFLEEERVWIDHYLAHGFVDTYRALHPEVAGRYSWWMYMRNARERNIGWRIDYFMVSEALVPTVAGADLLTEVMGSDHCPVTLDLEGFD